MLRDDARFLELLERWLTGDFTRSDEGELRALAAADAFRQAAWEGFASMPATEHQVHLERLRKRLQTPGHRRIPIGAWLAAAAALAVLLVVVYFLPHPQLENTVPIAKSPDLQQEKAVESSPGLADTIDGLFGPKSGIAAVQTVPPQPSGNENLSKKRTSKSSPKLDGKLAKPVTVTPTTTAAAPAARQPEGKQPAAKPGNIPPPSDVAAEEDSAPTILRKENAVLRDADPSTKKDSAADQAFAKMRQQNQGAENKKAGLPQKASEAEPIGGWVNFHDFLRRTARLTPAARNNNVSGNVRLEFIIGPDGKPTNVRVTRSLGYGCDEEAMRLISLFDWAPPGPEPVIVEVPFVR